MSRVVSTKKQLERLVALVEEDPKFAKGICTEVQAAKKMMGVYSGAELLGPPVRTAAKWIKIRADMKSKAKKKMSQNKAELRATGWGPNKLQGFSNTEKSIIGLLHLAWGEIWPGYKYQ